MKSVVDGIAGFALLLVLAVLIGTVAGWLVVRVVLAAVAWINPT